MTTGIIHDQNLEKQIEKQMGCMTGFLQLFDRHQILTGKRLYSTKRLPPSQAVDSITESPSISEELERSQHVRSVPSPDRLKQSPVPEFRSPVPDVTTPAESPAKLPRPLPVFEFKEGTRSSWKFREAPRLSLDSRAIVDAKGSIYPREIRTNASILSANRCESNGDGGGGGVGGGEASETQRRSTSVIARLMGLEPLPHSCPEPMKTAELRRSASESRVSRDLLQYRLVDGSNFQQKQVPSNSGCNISSNVMRDNAQQNKSNIRPVNPLEYNVRTAKSEPQKAAQRGLGASTWKSPQQRKSFFNSVDFFPEPRQTVSLYGEIEKRLRMRGIDEPSKDLETLKQILEALQLKGLLHSKKSTEQINHRNFVYDRSFSFDDSPIVVMKPSRSPVRQRRTEIDSPPSSFRSRSALRRNLNPAGETLPAASPRRDRPEIDRSVRHNVRVRNSSSPTGSESSTKSTNSVVRKMPLNVETQRKGNDSVEQQRRVSPVHSPKPSFKRTGSDQTRSPRSRKPTAEIYSNDKVSVPVEDESSSISESSISTSSQTDTERTKAEEYKEGRGRSLLERCDKLLHSIAEITASELQPSPVSVLDSSFYKDDSSSPSPVMKRSIDFKDQAVDLEDEIWSPAISPVQSKTEEKPDDCDFLYISEILRASDYLPEDSDIFLLLEKQQYLQGKDTSKASTLQRKLILRHHQRNSQAQQTITAVEGNFGDQFRYQNAVIASNLVRIPENSRARRGRGGERVRHHLRSVEEGLSRRRDQRVGTLPRGDVGGCVGHRTADIQGSGRRNHPRSRCVCWE
ncbi:hypothetical protein L1049_004364 [Liquidambar formosana]|uniref:DUF3741 domain-containing protein n=1 Tax=Liquidambar formosana TaxID=63359 RepID=A0AAP0RTQ1_LIQFO